jgi:hypothetical protein
MFAVLLAGLALWEVVLNWLTPTIAERQAKAAYQQAKQARQVAEMDLAEYEQGPYVQDVAAIALARSDQERAIDRLEWSTRMVAKGSVSRANNIADQHTLQQAQFDLEQARTRLLILEDYTKEKQKKSLRSNLEKAKTDENATLATYQFERARRVGLFGF